MAVFEDAVKEVGVCNHGSADRVSRWFMKPRTQPLKEGRWLRLSRSALVAADGFSSRRVEGGPTDGLEFQELPDGARGSSQEAGEQAGSRPGVGKSVVEVSIWLDSVGLTTVGQSSPSGQLQSA